MSLLQCNDQEIEVPIVDKNGKRLPVDSVQYAEYQIMTTDRDTVLLTKKLNDGITKRDNFLIISISKEDSKSLRRGYYHELTITAPPKGKSTVIKQPIFFEPTEI